MATTRFDAGARGETRATPGKATCETATRDREGLRNACLRPWHELLPYRELVCDPLRDSKHTQADGTVRARAQERRKHPSSPPPGETARTATGVRRLHHSPPQRLARGCQPRRHAAPDRASSRRALRYLCPDG